MRELKSCAWARFPLSLIDNSNHYYLAHLIGLTITIMVNYPATNIWIVVICGNCPMPELPHYGINHVSRQEKIGGLPISVAVSYIPSGAGLRV